MYVKPKKLFIYFFIFSTIIILFYIVLNLIGFFDIPYEKPCWDESRKNCLGSLVSGLENIPEFVPKNLDTSVFFLEGYGHSFLYPRALCSIESALKIQKYTGSRKPSMQSESERHQNFVHKGQSHKFQNKKESHSFHNIKRKLNNYEFLSKPRQLDTFRQNEKNSSSRNQKEIYPQNQNKDSRIQNQSLVYVLMTSKTLIITPIIRKLRKKYPRLKFVHINYQKYILDSPLKMWYLKKSWLQSKWPTDHFNDALRFVILWHFGGLYFDLDAISTKNLLNMSENIAGYESKKWVACGVLKFRHKHPVIWECLKTLSRKFDGTQWGGNGPMLFTKVLVEKCKLKIPHTETPNCPDVKIMKPEAFYSIPWQDWKKYFEETTNKSGYKNIFSSENAYAAHVWNHLSFNTKVMENSPYANLAKEYCPITFSETKGAF